MYATSNPGVVHQVSIRPNASQAFCTDASISAPLPVTSSWTATARTTPPDEEEDGSAPLIWSHRERRRSARRVAATRFGFPADLCVMMAESSRSVGKKRARDEEEGGDQMLALENNLTFSDTLIALQMMRAQFPNVGKVSVQPFILRSQLYSSVKDRTQVDRDLESLKGEKVLRLFKLNTGQDDHAVMFRDDYLKQMEIAVKRLGTKNCDNEVFEWFRKYVIESKLDVSIDHQELCLLLSLGGKVKDEHVTLLISAGLLTRQLIDPKMYWFAIPNIGSILKGLSQGRRELLSFLNRRKYKEMFLALLEKKRLRLSPLDMRFHLRDLIGSGHVKTLQTPTGLVVRLSKD